MPLARRRRRLSRSVSSVSFRFRQRARPRPEHGRWRQAGLGRRGPHRQPEGGRRPLGSAADGRSADPRFAAIGSAGNARRCTSARSGEEPGLRPPTLVSSTRQRQPDLPAEPARPCPMTSTGRCPGLSERRCSRRRARRALARPKARRREPIVGEARRACNRIWDQAAGCRWARTATQR